MSNTYLKDVLSSQTLTENSNELKALHKRREEVENLLRDKFAGSNLTIRYGGSKAKGTMIKESFDLDLIAYFAHEDTSAGSTLKEIYEEVESVLQGQYFVQRKTSALRLLSLDSKDRVDFHVDVVPGRYVNGDNGDVFLHQSSGSKQWLKTNLDVHINHIKGSQVTDAIRLLKLWRERNHLPVRTFVLELLAVELLKNKKAAGLTDQLKHVWIKLRDEIATLSVEDPANPIGNDLSDQFDSSVKSFLSSTAKSTLDLIESSGWEKVFGSVSTAAAAPAIIIPSFPVRPSGSFGG